MCKQSYSSWNRKTARRFSHVFSTAVIYVLIVIINIYFIIIILFLLLQKAAYSIFWVAQTKTPRQKFDITWRPQRILLSNLENWLGTILLTSLPTKFHSDTQNT